MGIDVMDSISSHNAPEVRALRKWFLLALIFSLAFHAGLFTLFNYKKLERFTFNTSAPRLVSRPFTVKKVVINEELLKPEKDPVETKKPEAPAKVIQNEKPSLDKSAGDLRFTPTATPTGDLTKAITGEKPRVEPGKIASPQANSQLEKELDSLQKTIDSKNAPKIVAGTGALSSAKSGNADAAFNKLDDLLAQSGPLKGDGARLNMDREASGGALFEYDSAKLKPEAIQALRQLGALIERNPRATFSIEGYTDSFGTPEYNKKLSQARADAVKAWLLSNMKLDPAGISAKGFGSERPRAPLTGTREEQAPNRRVEIVIRTPKE
jgi:outer membrane protein OmpA-like peptidoglycan-associated protein